MRHMGLCGTKEGFLKGLCLGSPNPEPNAEAALCKASRLHMKEIHLLILKHWYLLGYSLGQTLVDTIFLFSLCLAKVSSTILPTPCPSVGYHPFLFPFPIFSFFSLFFSFFFPSEYYLCTPHLSHVSQWVPFLSSSAVLQSAFIFWRGSSTQHWCFCFYIW